GRFDGLHRARCVPARSPQACGSAHAAAGFGGNKLKGRTNMRHLACRLLLLQTALSAFVFAQTNADLPLTLKEAQDLALRNHPKITAAQLRAMATRQVVTETRSAFFPTASLNVTSAGADSDNTRVLARALNNP